MRKLATFCAAALVGIGAVASTEAEARNGKNRRAAGAAVAAGVAGAVVGGLLASQARSAPVYGTYGQPSYAPNRTYGYYGQYPGHGYGRPVTRYRETYAYRPRTVRRTIIERYDDGYDYGYADRRGYRYGY